jgi:hypothetical protein
MLEANFGEHSFRNCLVNSWMGLDRVFWVAQSDSKGASSPILPTPGTLKWSPFGFSKQFRKVNSPKFAGTEFSEVRRCGGVLHGDT